MKLNKKQKKEILSPFSPDFASAFDPNRTPDVDDYYYDAMDLLGGGAKEIKEALRLLNIALEMDKDYVQTDIAFVSAYNATGEKKKPRKLLKPLTIKL